MNRKYLIWSFDYYDDSAGQKTMHRLCHELNLAGQQAFVGFPRRNPAWDTPYRNRPFRGDWIAVYPEIVRGNPWRAPRVVRYVLNHPGKLGGDRTYPSSEIVYCFSEMFNDIGLPPDRIMFLPTIELDIYSDRRLPRSGSVFYVGKGRQTREIPGALEITNDLKRDRALLAETLNRAEVLYTFDTASAMVEIARLCGCPVVVIPDGEVTREEYDRWVGWEGIGWDEVPPPFDSDAVRARYAGLYDQFRERLVDFIRVTQA